MLLCDVCALNAKGDIHGFIEAAASSQEKVAPSYSSIGSPGRRAGWIG
jgi:hypothetical protein